jgi:hypothetical protein
MSFSKPYTYVTGVVLDASSQVSNDDAAKKFINQSIVFADQADAVIDFDSIQSGELDPITNKYAFMSGDCLGRWTGKDQVSRSYFTSHIKNGRQTGATPEIYQTIPETGQTLWLRYDADIIISFGASSVCSENTVQANGQWDSLVILRYKVEGSNNWIKVQSARSYIFEETGTASAGAHDPTDTALTPAGGYGPSAKAELCLRRWTGWTWTIQGLSPGRYQFAVSISPKVESGFFSAKSFTCEVFYA